MYEIEVCVFYPYRTAMTQDVLIVLPRALFDENNLYHKVSEYRDRPTRPDNHTVVGVRGACGDTIYLMFTDFSVVVGRSVKVCSW